MEISPLVSVFPREAQFVLALCLLFLFSLRFSCETFSTLEEFLRRRRLRRYHSQLQRKYADRKGIRLRPRKMRDRFQAH